MGTLLVGREPLFADRREAGRELATLLPPRSGRGAVVVGLARGGVVVAAEVATARGWPLDALAVRKVGHPDQPELAIGAVAPGGVVHLEPAQGLAPGVVEEAVRRAEAEAAALDRLLHEGRAAIEYDRYDVLLVDDGIATGATMIAAARWARSRTRGGVAVAVPLAGEQSIARVLADVDELYCAHVCPELVAVGLWYAEFPAVSTAEVVACLDGAPAR